MNKENANHIKTFEKIGFVVNSFPSPQGNVGSNLIVVEVVTFDGGKEGQGGKA
jgi:hypothetical protein